LEKDHEDKGDAASRIRNLVLQLVGNNQHLSSRIAIIAGMVVGPSQVLRR
jgi:hypothetical protein